MMRDSVWIGMLIVAATVVCGTTASADCEDAQKKVGSMLEMMKEFSNTALYAVKTCNAKPTQQTKLECFATFETRLQQSSEQANRLLSISQDLLKFSGCVERR